MSKVLAPPGRLSPSRRSKVDRSWRILSGTAAAATGTLLLWLVVAAMIGRGVGPRTGLVLAVEPPDSVADVLAPVAPDADLIAGAVGLDGNGAAGGAAELERRLEGLSGGGPSPRVVYLSAVGISDAADGGGARPYFLPVGGDPGDPGSLIPADRVIGWLADRSRSGGPTLLILDAAHLDSDRGAGVFANGFLHRLDGLIPEDGDLVVLTPCAPGQVSWSAGPFGRSVFADCVARSDAWGRGTVSDLHEDVASRVSAWARAHRDAEQTPLLLGNVRRRDFRLPPLRGAAPTPAPPAADDALTGRLRDAWEAHRALAEDHPERTAPMPWRRYRDELLRAERLLRAGRIAEAGLALNGVEALAAALRQQLDAPPSAGLPSHALRLATAPPGRREALRREWEAHEAAIRRVLDGDREAAGPVATPAGAGTAAPEAGGPAGGNAPSSGTGADAEPGTAAAPPSIESLPPSAEALLAKRYAQFVGLGGESDDLRPARLEGLRVAFDVAASAERAAAIDGRLIPWVGPIVERGDRARREGQDLLFAGDAEVIRSGREPLREAEARYAEALALAGPLTEAVELLQELADVLPYYGEWAAPDPARHALIGSLLDEAAGLADRVAGPPSGWASATAPGDSAALDEIRGRLGKVRGGYGALRRAFDQAVGIASRPGMRPRWRQVDALLRVPTIPVEARMALVAASASPGLSPLPAPDAGGGTAEAAPDEAFWARALGLARLELGLMRMGGESVDELRGYLGTADAWRTAPGAAFGAMDSLSRGVRRRRDALLAPEAGAARAALDRADWLARALPASAMAHRFGQSEGPGSERAARDRQALLAWHGRRLADDLALDLARDALIAADALGADAPELAEARLELNRAQSRAIRVENLGAGDEPSKAAPGLAISGGEAMPEGHAAVFLKHDPAVSLRARPKGGAVVAVPVGDRVERRFDIDFAEGVDVVPSVYYRGRVFDAGRVAVPQVEQVSVAIRQFYDRAVDSRGNEILVRGRPIKVLDQFDEHPDEGYLHPNSTLDYRLELTNWTAEPLRVVVTQRWEEGPAKEARVELPPGERVARAAVGQISSIDFGPEAASRTLTVEVREQGGLGRLLCKPKQVVFRRLEPQQYISVHPHFAGGRVPQVGLFVQHLNTDRTTVPAHVTVAIEPFAAVLQIEAPQWVERGSFVTCRYRIVDPKVESLKFSLTVDGVPNAIVQEYTIQAIKEAPPQPPADPNQPPNVPRL